MLAESCDSDGKNFKTGVWSSVILFLVAYGAYVLAKSEIADVLQDSHAVLLTNIFAVLLIAAAAILACSLYFNFSKVSVLLAYTFISANMMWLINKAAVFYQETKKPTTKHMAELINMNRKEGDLVFCYKRYYQDFPVYLNSTVGVVDFVGELEFGAGADKNNDKLMTEDDFWKLWNSTNERVFLLLSPEHYREAFSRINLIHRVLDFDKYFIVITNR
jgi:hypothetical protein